MDTVVPAGITMKDSYKGETGVLNLGDGHEGDKVNVCFVDGAGHVLYERFSYPDTRKELQVHVHEGGGLPVCTFDHSCSKCYVPAGRAGPEQSP